MFSLRIEVLSGAHSGRVLEPDRGIVRIGRAPANDLQLTDAHVSSEHARIIVSERGVILEDLRSTNGTTLVRKGVRQLLGENSSLSVPLASEDVVELGGEGAESTAIRVTIEEDSEPEHVVEIRPISALPSHTGSSERDRAVLKTLHDVQAAIARADTLEGALAAVADASLAVVQRATHVTLALRTEAGDDELGAADAAVVPVATRVRGPDGKGRAPASAVPVTRSVFRKVLKERAAVLAVDAPSESFSSESLLGASIRSTIGVPLWKGEEVLGVLQLDNRDAKAMFDSTDLDALGVLAANASLAIANARLIRRLTLAEEQLKKENVYLKSRERERSGEFEIIGESRAMKQLMAQLDKVVDTRVSVLIEGETGTGKELIASAVHYRSRRRSKLFVAQNCAALPENLLESELFGHKRGAFTGASEEKKGLFEIADGGTLFLDEVVEMPAPLQAKLLRVLQEGEIRPLGATHTKHVNVRIVAACNRDLENEVRAGRFREDLLYRLKVFPIRVPPLRERREDIALLANHFLDRYTKDMGKPVSGYAQDTLELLAAYDWPGNVRELENEVQRLVIQAETGGFITSDLLSPRVRHVEGIVAQATSTKGSLKDMVEQVEKYFVLEALREHGNNKTSAAKALGITREGLHKKLRQLKIS